MKKELSKEKSRGKKTKSKLDKSNKKWEKKVHRLKSEVYRVKHASRMTDLHNAHMLAAPNLAPMPTYSSMIGGVTP